MLKKRILICGGREYADNSKFNQVMDHLLQYFDPHFCVIHGGARGADAMSEKWAEILGRPTLSISANWNFYGKRAGSLRNQWMLDYATPDLVIAFPGGVGTANMVRIARNNKIDVYEVK